MGSSASKTTNKPSRSSSFAPNPRRISKRILMRNSAVYPKGVENTTNVNIENNNNNKLDKDQDNNQTVVLRKKEDNDLSNESLNDSTTKVIKKEKKKKKSDAAISGEDCSSTYHQTAVNYFCSH